jgi:deazaflavin-dependent oxidoreductase (nitroreductase family)
MTSSDTRPDYAAFTRALIEEHRANGGKLLSGPFKDRAILLLHTVGAKTGEPRITPVAYSRDGDRYVVLASKRGEPTNPGWFANLVANPEVTIEAEGETFKARAHVEAEGPERDRLWAAHKAQHPGFADYEQMTTRIIPAVSLERIS